MNTLGYLILIAALMVLAGFMLYARFAPRSGQTALHHAPVDWGHKTEKVLVSRPGETGQREKTPAADSEVPEEPIARLDLLPKPEGKRDSAEDRGYFDELQEAAAGLAKLMRSSPVARAEPVVFAPETEAAPEDEGRAEESLPAVEEEIVAEVETITPEPEAEHVAEEEAEAMEMAGGDDPGETIVPLTFRERLGDEVADQLDRIDGSLAALELLVDGIQSSLMELRRIDLDETGLTIPAEEETDRVAAAA